MPKYKKSSASANTENVKKPRFLTIFICIFTSLVVVLGATLGIVAGVKSKNNVINYNGVKMDVPTASFFASQYKYSYMNMLSLSGIKGVEDSPGFWATASENGKTYGELLRDGTEKYIKQIAVTNYLFDKYAKLSDDDEKTIELAIEETLEYKAGGNVSKFNDAVSEFGFDFDSYKKAVEMLYKASSAQTVVCGADGSVLRENSEETNEYLSEYSHIKLLIIRTETTFVVNENGNRVMENGTYKTRDLTEEEKSERLVLIDEIRSYISAIGTDGAQMGAEMFDYYLSHNGEGDPDMNETGYYIHKDSEFGQAFKSYYPDIYDKAFAMSLDTYSEVELDYGVCFIYKCAPSSIDLTKKALEECFSDFYSNLSDVFFSEQLEVLSESVEIGEKYSEIDVITLPYNYIYVPSFG